MSDFILGQKYKIMPSEGHLWWVALDATLPLSKAIPTSKTGLAIIPVREPHDFKNITFYVLVPMTRNPEFIDMCKAYLACIYESDAKGKCDLVFVDGTTQIASIELEMRK